MKSWIQHFISSAETSVLFVLKKNEDLWLCVDYKDLNKITIKNHHSFSFISEILNCLNDTKIFIKLNLKNIYHQIRIHQDNKWKTAFYMWYNHFKYLIMLFELANALIIFQIYINCIFAEHMNSICVVYLDDILIYSQSLKKHEHYVCKILKWLQCYKLFVNLKKCAFSINEIEFLKFIISINSVMMNLWKVNIIKEWLISQSFKNVQIFLRFTNFYRHFIKIYSKIADFFTGLLKDSKNEKKFKSFKWSKETAETFTQFKDIFMTMLLLMHYNLKLKNWMKTDASEHAVTEIYTQLQTSKQWHFVIYWLWKLSSTKNNYKIHDLKLLAIIETFKQ